MDGNGCGRHGGGHPTKQRVAVGDPRVGTHAQTLHKLSRARLNEWRPGWVTLNDTLS